MLRCNHCFMTNNAICTNHHPVEVEPQGMSQTEKLLVLDTLASALGLLNSLKLEDLSTNQQLALAIVRVDLETSHKIVLESA